MSGERLTVLIIACALIVAGVLAGLPRAARLGATQSATRRPSLDALWTILPIAFLVALVIVTVRVAS